MKNIGPPPQREYLFCLISMVKSFMGRFRWKAYHILHPAQTQEKETYGFNTSKTPPYKPDVVQSLALFERNFTNLISNVKFKKKTNSFQRKLNEDTRNINNDPKLIIKADKTSNHYKVSNDENKTLLKREIEKGYKKGPQDIIAKNDRDDKALADELGILDRMIFKTQLQEAFYTLKDHKESFRNSADSRLINPAKTQVGKVAKQMLEKVVKVVKEKSGLNLLKNTQSAITWFKALQNKETLTFIQFDVTSFYPSISKKLLIEAIDFARQFTTITNLEKKVIIQSCRSVLINDGVPWVNKGDENDFGVTMGSFSGAEVCELWVFFCSHN